MPGSPEHAASEEHAPLERGRQLDRVNAFSDGLFTIAATLLVLSIQAPDVPKGQVDAELGHKLAALFNSAIPTYFLSFAVIGLFWLRHHQLFGRLSRSDNRFAALNLAFLAFVALLPFPTQMLGRYGHEPVVVAMYAGNLLTLSVLLQVLGHDARRRGLIHRQWALHDRAERVRGLTAVVMFAISIPLAWVDTRISIACWLVVNAIPRIVLRRLDQS